MFSSLWQPYPCSLLNCIFLDFPKCLLVCIKQRKSHKESREQTLTHYQDHTASVQRMYTKEWNVMTVLMRWVQKSECFGIFFTMITVISGVLTVHTVNYGQ